MLLLNRIRPDLDKLLRKQVVLEKENQHLDGHLQSKEFQKILDPNIKKKLCF